MNMRSLDMFLFLGLQDSKSWNTNADLFSGATGAADWLCGRNIAARVGAMEDALWIVSQDEWGGVFEYEVVESLGAWLCEKGPDVTDAEVDAKLVDLCSEFCDFGNSIKSIVICALIMKELQDGKDAESAGRRVLRRILDGHWEEEVGGDRDSAPFDCVFRMVGLEGPRAQIHVEAGIAVL
jgi:hypothetical protein